MSKIFSITTSWSDGATPLTWMLDSCSVAYHPSCAISRWKEMTNSRMQAIRRWFLMHVLKQPVCQQPRKAYERHAAGCYLCPRRYCRGVLNDHDDLHQTKPRLSSSGHCVYLKGAHGVLRLLVSARGANDHYKRRSAERGYSDTSTREMWAAVIDGLGDQGSLEMPL